jgi:4-oxalocrotonate tautomerase family enzyme
VAIQITLLEGRSREQKKDLFAIMADSLHERAGVRREDVFVSLIEVAKENWSLGDGVAQYADAC